MMLLCMVTLFLLLTPFSFVKLLKNMIDELVNHFKSPQPPHPQPPPPTTLQKRWISPRTLKTAPREVRVKGGMSLRNGMWHGLRNDIIMQNVIYAE